MSDLNQVTLTGRVGQKPSVYHTEEAHIVRFSIASTEHYKSGEEIKERVQWNSIAIYDKYKAEQAEKQLKQGSPVLIQGILETHSYEKDGETKYSTEVAVRPYKGFFKCLDVKPQAAHEANDAPDLATVAGKRQQQQQVRSHDQ